MPTYQYETNSHAAPFCSDADSGFIEAADPMAALRKVCGDYKHPFGLHAAAISLPTPDNPTVARYNSSRAATSIAGGCGLHETKRGNLYVDGAKQEPLPESYELVAYPTADKGD